MQVQAGVISAPPQINVSRPAAAAAAAAIIGPVEPRAAPHAPTPASVAPVTPHALSSSSGSFKASEPTKPLEVKMKNIYSDGAFYASFFFRIRLNKGYTFDERENTFSVLKVGAAQLVK